MKPGNVARVNELDFIILKQKAIIFRSIERRKDSMIIPSERDSYIQQDERL
jgi:hypothetical protein